MSNIERSEITQPFPREENPRVFFTTFRQSPVYIASIEQFFAGKKLADDVTAEEKRVAFEESTAAKIALIEYAEHQIHFHYNPEQFLPTSRQAIDSYVSHVRQMVVMLTGGADRDTISRLDIERTRLHIAVADAITVEGSAPTTKMARALGRLILIEQKLDTYYSAAEPDMMRINRVVK